MGLYTLQWDSSINVCINMTHREKEQFIIDFIAEVRSDVSRKNFLPLKELLSHLLKDPNNERILKSFLCSDIPENREEFKSDL